MPPNSIDKPPSAELAPGQLDSDRGVPAMMFGDVPGEFYSVVGWVTLIAALLEERLHVLFCALARTPQDCMAGEPGTVLIRECRTRLDAFRLEQRDDAAAFLHDAEAALLRRHQLVHSLWPFTKPRAWVAHFAGSSHLSGVAS